MKFIHEGQVSATRPEPERFTDGVWETRIIEEARPGGLRAQRFTYEPGSRSGWHTHEGEQALHVIAGRGVVTREGEVAGTRVGPGDWVHVEPGERHWHGAAADDTFVHIAVTASGRTRWHHAVSDEEYGAGVGERAE
ncbi:cupin domain-containing protein [Sphaerisporangium sp. TRM90804]|uniref:cupin domain-containing protein n=1 Tax=Sphaerisporangium sp. TRM90804 TaxID=3031113 RepID=UPI00244A23CD|nr:cupin domain-containing protein [Sphaerisporangium sp. TRM90804]MDH2430845.1 cupin domain-containing protein [Sphaerisporangium sp. TRM90804]